MKKKELTELESIEETFRAEMKLFRDDLKKLYSSKKKIESAAKKIRDDIRATKRSIKVAYFGSDDYRTCMKKYREEHGFTWPTAAALFPTVLSSLYDENKVLKHLNCQLDKQLNDIAMIDDQIDEVKFQMDDMEHDFESVKRQVIDHDFGEFPEMDDSAFDFADRLTDMGY